MEDEFESSARLLPPPPETKPEPAPPKLPDRPFRVKLRGSVLVLVRLPNKRSVRAAIHQLSTSGGVIHLEKPLDEKLEVEMIFHLQKQTIRSKAQMLFPMAALRKAYELRDRASEREKFYIEAHYYDEVVVDFEKALDVYMQWSQTYPRDSAPYSNAALASSALGMHEKALEHAVQGHQVDPRDAYCYDNMAGAYEALNRFDEAKSIAEEAVAKKVDGSGIHFVLLDLAYYRGDRAAVQHEEELGNGVSER